MVVVGLWWCLCKSFPLATMGKFGLRCGQVDGMEWGGEATGSRLLANTIWSAFHVLVLPLSSWRIVESRRIEHLECYRWCRWKARECATWMDALIRRVRFVRGVCARFAQRIRCLYLMRTCCPSFRLLVFTHMPFHSCFDGLDNLIPNHFVSRSL